MAEIDIEKLVVKRLLQKIYQDSRRSLNCLVMLDEAHRFANKEVESSREKSEIGDKRGIVAILKQYVRETRKFGVGWMFVSTSLAEIQYCQSDRGQGLWLWVEYGCRT